MATNGREREHEHDGDDDSDGDGGGDGGGNGGRGDAGISKLRSALVMKKLSSKFMLTVLKKRQLKEKKFLEVRVYGINRFGVVMFHKWNTKEHHRCELIDGLLCVL